MDIVKLYVLDFSHLGVGPLLFQRVRFRSSDPARCCHVFSYSQSQSMITTCDWFEVALTNQIRRSCEREFIYSVDNSTSIGHGSRLLAARKLMSVRAVRWSTSVGGHDGDLCICMYTHGIRAATCGFFDLCGGFSP